MKMQTFFKGIKRPIVVLSLFLPLVWIVPTNTWAEMADWLTSDPVARADEMHRFGKRSEVSIQAFPMTILNQVGTLAADNECDIEDTNLINLGEPPEFSGYEAILDCPGSPSPTVFLYFDERGNYLNAIPVGSD